jgi:hypothetical protein
MRAARRHGGGATQLRFQWSHRDLRGQAPSTNAQPAKPALLVINTAQTAGSSAAASVWVDCAHPATSQSRSLIFSHNPPEGGNSRVLTAATPIDSEQLLWPPAFRSHGRQSAAFVTVSVQLLLTVDT